MNAALRRARLESRVTPRAFGSEPHVWFDACRQRAGGTTWTDYSANARNAFNNNAGQQPGYSDTAFNSYLPAWTFDGAADYQRFGLASNPTWGDFKQGDGWHFLIVLSDVVDNGAVQELFTKYGSGSRGIILRSEEANQRIEMYIRNSASNSIWGTCNSVEASAVDPALVEWLYDGSQDISGTAYKYMNAGTPVTPTVVMQNNALSATITTTQFAAIGVYGLTLVNWFQGNMALFITFLKANGPEPLSTQQQHRLRRQISRRYAI